MSSSPQYLSTAQAGERLGISREHVRRLIQRGELRAEETVNGFMLDAFEVDQYSVRRQVLQDQRQFRVAVDEFATQARRLDKATGIQSAVAQMRDQMKQHPVFEVPAVVAPHLRWIEQEIAAQKALAVLVGPAETIKEQWHRYDEDARRAMGHVVSGVSAHDKMVQVVNVDEQQSFAKVGPAGADSKSKIADMQGAGEVELRRREGWEAERLRRQGNVAASPTEMLAADLPRRDERFANLTRDAGSLEIDPHAIARNEVMARGFVVPERREARLEEKMDELGRKVEQLTELVLRQRADTTTETPTWQEWAGSDRPEDVLAKLDAVREEVTGGKRMPENSTDIIRASREARGSDG